NKISLDDISRYMGLSIVHVLRIFKKEFGLPIHSYLLNKKVHLAKELLSKNMPISEVAQTSGFFDQSHLNKSFKRVFQLTPNEYKKNILHK
ncbi:MAG: AraC-like DNA-binding protein, partial [Sulfurimonas sp.]|uniref:helix-turn-helix domain-containing protein n=1 Tax=Sulfurimonas sp. TaxID=2022749 RepID=UPI0039E466E1